MNERNDRWLYWPEGGKMHIENKSHDGICCGRRITREWDSDGTLLCHVGADDPRVCCDCVYYWRQGK